MSEVRTAPQVSARGYLRLVLLGALIGIPAAFLAAGFLALVHEIEHWLWEDLPEAIGADQPPWYLVVGLPVVGALIVLLARRALPGDGGHEPMHGISVAPTPLSYGPGVALAAVGSLAFGAVIGPEAPLIALGSVVGLAATRFVRLGPAEQQVLATAGSFSAISAIFGGPLVAGVILTEAGLAFGTALIPMLLPGLVAAAVGYVIFVGLGDWGGLASAPIAVPDLPVYDGTRVVDLVIAVVAGVLIACVVECVRFGAFRVQASRGRLGLPALLVGGALVTGLLALIARALGADSQDVLFSGQASVPALVGEDSARIVLVLVVAKALAYAVCLGCGFRGGPVFPAIFLGIGLVTFGVVWFDVSPTLAIAVGTAAGMVAMTRLLITSVLLAALLVGSAGVDAVPAAVLAAATAWLTVHGLDRWLEAKRPFSSASP